MLLACWNCSGLCSACCAVACRGRHALVVENLLLRQQLAVALRSRLRPRLTRRDRLFWVLARWLTTEWRRHLVLVSPDTVVRWHRQGWRLFWRWRSRTRLGRPHVPAEVRELIATMSRENVLWGTERIRGELLKLGIEVSNRSIRRYRWRGEPTAAEPDLAHLPAEPRARDLGGRSVHRPDPHLPHPVRPVVHRPRTA